MNHTKKGFTLIEILVAVTIVAVLSIIGVVSYSSINKRSRDAKRKSDLEQVRSALEMYRADNGSYPSVNASNLQTADNLTALVPDYVPQLPSDPKYSSSNPSAGPFYYYQPTNGVDSGGTTLYYGYCICGDLENSGSNSCDSSVATIANCNYYLKNP